MIIVAGHLVVDADRRDQALETMRAAVIAARSTPGCLDFAVSPDIVDPARVNVCERWTDRGSLERFRGDGPSGDLAPSILGFSVEEYEI